MIPYKQMSNSPQHPSKTAPKPETRRAFLISAGYPRPTPTVHHFYEARRVTLPGTRGVAWEFIYRCFKTGAERRWGTANALEIVGADFVQDDSDSEEGN